MSLNSNLLNQMDVIPECKDEHRTPLVKIPVFRSFDHNHYKVQLAGLALYNYSPEACADPRIHTVDCVICIDGSMSKNWGVPEKIGDVTVTVATYTRRLVWHINLRR